MCRQLLTDRGWHAKSPQLALKKVGQWPLTLEPRGLKNNSKQFAGRMTGFAWSEVSSRAPESGHEVKRWGRHLGLRRNICGRRSGPNAPCMTVLCGAITPQLGVCLCMHH